MNYLKSLSSKKNWVYSDSAQSVLHEVNKVNRDQQYDIDTIDTIETFYCGNCGDACKGQVYVSVVGLDLTPSDVIGFIALRQTRTYCSAYCVRHVHAMRRVGF